MTCPACDTEIADDAPICPACGYQRDAVEVRVGMSVDQYVGELICFGFASVVVSVGVAVLVGVAMIVLGVFGGLVGGV